MRCARHRLWVFLAFCACLAAGYPQEAYAQRQGGARGAQPSATAAPGAEPLRTGVDRPFDVRDIRLELRVDLAQKTVDGKATIQVSSLRTIRTISLDAVGFEIKQVTLANGSQDGKGAHFSHDGKKLTIDLDSPWPAGKSGTLSIDYRVRDPKDGLHFFAPTASDPKAPLSVWSQGEPVSNRYWFPCVDEPGQRQTTQMIVTVPEGFEAVSNGKLVERKENPADHTVTFDWRQDKPHPAYLVTLAVGQYDVVRETWGKVPVLYYVPKGRKEDVARSFGHTPEMLSFFSKRFGIQYPWDKYAQVIGYQYGGGMENTSATTLGEMALRDERGMTDGPADSLIAHELAHQWWGDMVTCRDWAHLWLNEGFASYAEALWDEHSKGPDEYALNMYQKSRGAMASNSRPVVDRHYPTPDTMFDGRSYPKGAWILHMLRQQLGDEAFWNSIQRYGTEHRFQSAETTDFRRTVERETGRDLERFFYDWTERPGHPVLDIVTEYLPAAQQAKIVVKQTQTGEAFHFPLKVVFHYTGREPTVIQQQVTDKEYTFLIPLPARPEIVEVDPDQAVLAEMKETKDASFWQAQLGAPGVVSRVRAARHLAGSKVESDRDLLAKALVSEKSSGVRVEIAGALAKIGGTPSRDALLQAMSDADSKVRRACLEGLTKFAADPVIATAAKEVLHKGDPSYTVEAAAMGAVAKHGGKEGIALLTAWLTKPSTNDVLRTSALMALGDVQDLSVLDALLTMAQPGHPRRARGAALRGLTQLLQKAKPNDDQRQQILKALTTALEEDNGATRFFVINALPDLGPLASSTLPALDKISRDDANARLRDLAKRTAEKIRSSSKPDSSVADATQVKQLREEVDRLKRERDTLRERLSRLEKTERK
jgi:aminopeptidase N